MAVPFFDITKQNESLKQELSAAISQVVDKGRFILGENVSLLEKEIAAYCEVKHAVGVASGTDALFLALKACGVKPGDEVITSPFTFVATAEAIEYCGARPIFVDIEPKTFNLDPNKIEQAITEKTRAVLPVHLYGQVSNMQKILKLCEKYNLSTVEDAAQAIGAKFDGKMAGRMGHVGCFSFFPTKNLGCFGDGGMITTNNDQIAQEIKVLRGHGSRRTYHYEIIGYNSRLDELQAAILRVKLPHLEGYAEARRRNANLYFENLKAVEELVPPYENPNGRHVFNQYTIRVKKRDALFEYLGARGVGRMVYYPLSLHLQEAFRKLGYKAGDFPESEIAQAQVLSLPIFPELEKNEIEQVCQAIKDFYKK